MDTLEASVWCWLTTDTYADAVVKAVNLGSDTDTTGAVTGIDRTTLRRKYHTD